MGTEFSNWIYKMSNSVARYIVKEKPEEFRNALKKLYNEKIPLKERITAFITEIFAIYRQMEPYTNYPHHQDERTTALYLTLS